MWHTLGVFWHHSVELSWLDGVFDPGMDLHYFMSMNISFSRGLSSGALFLIGTFVPCSADCTVHRGIEAADDKRY